MANEDVVQGFGALAPTRIGLSQEVRHKSVAALNRMLAHTLSLRDLYKPHDVATESRIGHVPRGRTGRDIFE